MTTNDYQLQRHLGIARGTLSAIGVIAETAARAAVRRIDSEQWKLVADICDHALILSEENEQDAGVIQEVEPGDSNRGERDCARGGDQKRQGEAGD